MCVRGCGAVSLCRSLSLRINEFSHFTALLPQKYNPAFKIHFIHERSPNPDAIPLLLLHGWPGSFLKFLELAKLLRNEFHLVIPSRLGYTFSDPPPADRQFGKEDVADLMELLMQGLGYEGYAVQVRKKFGILGKGISLK